MCLYQLVALSLARFISTFQRQVKYLAVADLQTEMKDVEQHFGYVWQHKVTRSAKGHCSEVQVCQLMKEARMESCDSS